MKLTAVIALLLGRPLLCAFGLLFLLATPVWAQDQVKPDASMRELIEAEEEIERLVEEKERSNPHSINARDTPLASLLGMRDAMNKSDLGKAGNFLDMRYLPEELDEYTAERLVQELSYVWNQQNIFDISSVSDEPEGHLDDATAIMRIDAGISATNYQEFLAVAENLNLAIVKAVQDAGASFSGPSHTLKFDKSAAGEFIGLPSGSDG